MRALFARICIVLTLGVFSSLSFAHSIHVFGDRGGDRNMLTNTLTGLGHTVTNSAALSGDLSGFDTVWHVGAFSGLSGGVQSSLQSFVNAGGGLHLTGERPCCDAMNDTIESLINSLVAGGGVSVGRQGDAGSNAVINAGATGDVASAPNALSVWNPSASGIISGIIGDNILATIGANAVGGIWNSEDLVGDAGRVSLLMDVNWFSNLTEANQSLVENLQVYLAGAGTPPSIPEPATLALFGLGLVGFGFARRRKV